MSETSDVQLKEETKLRTKDASSEPDMSTPLEADSVDALADFVTSFNESEYNRRETYRVPLRQSELKVQIRKGERIYAVTPTNISITGIFVIPRAGERPLEFSNCDKVQVILDLDGKVLTYDGVVVRHQGNGFGFFFPESMQGEQIHPPRELVQLVMELQRRMIERQARSSFGI